MPLPGCCPANFVNTFAFAQVSAFFGIQLHTLYNVGEPDPIFDDQEKSPWLI